MNRELALAEWRHAREALRAAGAAPTTTRCFGRGRLARNSGKAMRSELDDIVPTPAPILMYCARSSCVIRTPHGTDEHPLARSPGAGTGRRGGAPQDQPLRSRS